jgi:hypothetical protein
MDMFASTTVSPSGSAACARCADLARLPVLVPLAWHLRQRDTARAVELAAEGLPCCPPPPGARRTAS